MAGGIGAAQQGAYGLDACINATTTRGHSDRRHARRDSWQRKQSASGIGMESMERCLGFESRVAGHAAEGERRRARGRRPSVAGRGGEGGEDGERRGGGGGHRGRRRLATSVHTASTAGTAAIAVAAAAVVLVLVLAMLPTQGWRRRRCFLVFRHSTQPRGGVHFQAHNGSRPMTSRS